MLHRIVFLVYHGTGHFNAFFTLAKILQGNNYEVVFAGVEFFRQYVTLQGFTYYSLKSVPFGMNFEYWVNTIRKSKVAPIAAIRDRYNDSLYIEREKELNAMLSALNPDIILIDSFQSTDFIVLYPHLLKSQIPVALVQPSLPSVLRPTCPPMDSLVLPDQKASVKKVYYRRIIINYIKQIGRKILYLGADNNYIIKRRIRATKISDNFFSSKRSLLAVTLQNIPEFILSTREFDFVENSTSPDQHYVGFMLDQNRVDICDTEYLNVISSIKADLAKRKRPVIYCSFGTVQAQSARLINKFMNRLLQISRKQDYVLIISGKNSVAPDSSFKNVYIFKRVPQPEVLAMTDVFITHGGMNSIKESIYAEVPMLLYLANSNLDQQGCSSRVIYHQLGLRGRLRQDSEKDISDKIQELLYNPVYKQRLRQFKTHDAGYTPEKLLQLIKGLSPLSLL